jgi:hypothetical protein
MKSMKNPELCTDQELAPYAREYMRRLRAGHTARPKVLRPCPKCGRPFGARELRKHIPDCPKK